jgi:mono/diheme cytochrome c family protein
VATGRALFVKERCGGCHALRAVGAKGGQGPSFDARRERLSRAQLRRALAEGANGMPSYARRLSPRQLDQLTAFLMTLRR